jgi:hypothetical protein
MLLGLSNIAAGIMGFFGWPWWIAAVIGLLAGVQQSSSTLYRSPWGDMIKERDPSAIKLLIVNSLTGGVVGGGVGTAIYFIVHHFSN